MQVVAGDVLDAAAVAAVAAGHDAAISAVYDPQAAPLGFFASAATSLLDGLPKAGVARALVVGVVSTLDVAPGLPMFQAPDFPDEYREFGRGHMAGLQAFRDSATDLDWLVVTPPMVLDDGTRTGSYRIGGDEGLASSADRFTDGGATGAGLNPKPVCGLVHYSVARAKLGWLSETHTPHSKSLSESTTCRIRRVRMKKCSSPMTHCSSPRTLLESRARS
ncbi:NAD(P)H-binding protein [Nocardia amamiensis]|uniref:NAD(P)H-binding protein n=1 Tax=Nocardia amamiensis TaxID=404578 RepID=A0ABS0D1W4_9NOCA|nr:NAD(P)H-binding protein [Nocardia amamiensis]MBF6302827.1 NAD(P)H-binding protein [Nocardia amamiensis]